MSDTFFSFPKPDKRPEDVGLDLDSKAIEHWLNELPLADMERAAPELLDYLTKINQIIIDPIQRCNILELILPKAKDINSTLRDKYISALLPPNTRANKCYQLTIELNRQIITCEKIIIAGLLKSQTNENESVERLVNCLYHAAHFTSMILLESYLVYSTGQKSIWLELNQIYQFAEKHSLQNVEILLESDSDITETISTAYARAVLLSMTNPYYLMQGEALAVFQLLNKIAHGIKISNQPMIDSQKANYCIDLKSDRPPIFITSDLVPTGEVRYFFVSKLLNMLAANISRLDSTISSLRKKRQSSGKLQSQRDMLDRIHNSWGRSGKRVYERFDIEGNIEMATSLSASHYNVSGQQRFAPELDEIFIHTKGAGVKQSGLSLAPMDSEPWKAKEAEDRIESGVDTHRSSSFDDQDANVDTWEKIYSAKAKKDSDEEIDDLKITYRMSTWSINNKSTGGFSLNYKTKQNISIKVGDVVAFLSDDNDSEAAWVTGCIRWLRMTDVYALDVGIMILSKKITAVASRSVKGFGEGSEYLRCLLIGTDMINDDLATLLTPAYIYNLGTILAVNTKDNITFVELTENLLRTNSLAQYKFKVVETPENEQENIKAIQDLM